MRRRLRSTVITACGFYVTAELPELVAAQFPGSIRSGNPSLAIPWAARARSPQPSSIADRYARRSAFAPIVAPSHVPWGIKALGGYLGDDKQAWRGHDAVALIEDGARFGICSWTTATPIHFSRAAPPRIAAGGLRQSRHSPHLAPSGRLRSQLLLSSLPSWLIISAGMRARLKGFEFD